MSRMGRTLDKLTSDKVALVSHFRFQAGTLLVAELELHIHNLYGHRGHRGSMVPLLKGTT
jgi:hypothetical protein